MDVDDNGLCQELVKDGHKFWRKKTKFCIDLLCKWFFHCSLYFVKLVLIYSKNFYQQAVMVIN